MDFMELVGYVIKYGLILVSSFLLGSMISMVGYIVFSWAFISNEHNIEFRKLSIDRFLGIAAFGFLSVFMIKSFADEYSSDHPQEFCEEYCLLEYCELLFEDWKREN